MRPVSLRDKLAYRVLILGFVVLSWLSLGEARTLDSLSSDPVSSGVGVWPYPALTILSLLVSSLEGTTVLSSVSTTGS
jgi:hypothetical protein